MRFRPIAPPAVKSHSQRELRVPMAIKAVKKRDRVEKLASAWCDNLGKHTPLASPFRREPKPLFQNICLAARDPGFFSPTLNDLSRRLVTP